MPVHLRINPEFIRSFLPIFLTVLVGMISLTLEAKPENPNIVVILADDLGYGDVQCLNPHSRIPTPAMDSLAAHGKKYIDAHSPSAVCTPTRYGLLTGRYCWRSRLTSGVLNGYGSPLIEDGRLTVADHLKSAGYNTGIIGKWHLGLDFAPTNNPQSKYDFSQPLKKSPTAFGFNYSRIIPASLDFPPYVVVENSEITELPTAKQEAGKFPAFLRQGERSPDFIPEQILDRLTSLAVNFIDDHANAEKPFFLYFPLTAPHKPVLPAERFRGLSGLGPYGDFILQTDWTVGQILECLNNNKITDNTIVILTSDNGSFMYRNPPGSEDHTSDVSLQSYNEEIHRSNFIFRGTKADIYEAGHRVPFFVQWPARVRKSSVSTRTICHVDIFATVAELTGQPIAEGMAGDSVSFAPDLLDDPSSPGRPPVVHHSANGTFAIRDGDWKLILSDGSGGRENPRGSPFKKPFQLYNISTDPRESANLISQNPEIAKELERKLTAIRNANK